MAPKIADQYIVWFVVAETKLNVDMEDFTYLK